jgi:hypothetical protein
MTRLELTDGRGQFVMPTKRQIDEANLGVNGRQLFDAIVEADLLVADAVTAVETAKSVVNDKTQAVADATEHLARLRPAVSAVDAARAFILTGQQN